MRRVIARLDIKGERVIKGMQLEGWKYLDKHPREYCYNYYLQGIDEVIYIDAVASLYSRDMLAEIIKQTTENVFVPITAGGGVRTVDDAWLLLRSGADKVAVNSEAVKNPKLIEDIASRFGKQCMVSSIQAKRNNLGGWNVYYDVGREKTEIDVIEWAKEVIKLGAGEILITSIDNEGTKKGFDIELIKIISKNVDVPIIASGGFGKVNDFVMASNAGADAVAVARSLHYNENSVDEIKQFANKNGINVRL